MKKIKLYETIILELAKRLDTEASPLLDNPHMKEIFSNEAKHAPMHSWVNTPKDHTLHKTSEHSYTTLNNKGEAVHYSQFAPNRHKELPFKHTSQTMVGKSSVNKIEKHYAGNLALHHMEHTKTPLVSDSEQTEAGHKMWHHITKTAMDKGHHVYHWDGAKLHKTTSENHSEHMAKSFGKTPEHTKKHMVVSPHDLEKK